MSKVERCDVCGRFRARLTKTVGPKLPRTPEQKEAWKERVLLAGRDGAYGVWVYVPKDGEDMPEGHIIYVAALCPDHQGTHVFLDGKVGRCCYCGRKAYGGGNKLGHVCNDCARALWARGDLWPYWL